MRLLSGDQLSLWRIEKNGGQNTETPEPIDAKFGVGDYVGDITGHATNASDRQSGQMGEISLARFLIFCHPKFCSPWGQNHTQPIFTLFDS